MSASSRTLAASPARPQIEVRDLDGQLLPRISVADAEMLQTRGWATWTGKGRRRHLRLTAVAPLVQLPRGSRDATRPVRAAGQTRPDGTASGYDPGQCVGDPRTHREHLPLP